LHAALGEEKYKALSELMEVLEAVGRVPRRQSITEQAQQVAKREDFEAAPIISTVTRPWSGVREWWVSKKKEDWQAEIAKAITSPDAVTELKKLRILKEMSPGSKNAAEIVGIALARAGIAPFASAGKTPRASIPPRVQAPSR